MDVISVLQRVGSGRVLERLEDAINAASADVVETGNPATVTLVLKISTKAQGDVLTMVDGTVGRSVPKKAPVGAYFYVVDGELYKDDPRQAELEGFRTVDRETGEVREVSAPERVEKVIR